MIKIYYDPNNGNILKTATASYSLDGNEPFIEYPVDIIISEYQVDTVNKKLIPNQNKPVISNRRRS